MKHEFSVTGECVYVCTCVCIFSDYIILQVIRAPGQNRTLRGRAARLCEKEGGMLNFQRPLVFLERE